MMMFSIKNEKLGFFNRPIFANSANEALSLIQNILMSDSDRALSGLKSDLALYKVGEFDQVSGFLYFADAREADFDVDFCYGFPILISSLEDIFNSIPEESLKPALTQKDFDVLLEKYNLLQEKLNKLSSHSHNKKGEISFD